MGLYRDNGKEDGNHYVGLRDKRSKEYWGYRDNGKENGNYYII